MRWKNKYIKRKNMELKKKHAYLIMIHNNCEVLKRLLEMLDDERNDIYIHIDKKAKDVDEQDIIGIVKKSNVNIMKKIKVYWGHYSQVECEMLLLEEATKKEYEYYHLISGSDLPLKSQDEIHAFFNKNKGKEFIHFEAKEITNSKKEWICRYHVLQKYFLKFGKNYFSNMIQYIEKILLEIQRILNLNRYKDSYVLQSGANWFSITDDLARYVLTKKEWTRRNFKFTRSADEVFLQTIVFNSKFVDRLYNEEFNNNYSSSCMRYIDWERGKPYIFRENDFEELISSGCIFARKFNERVDFKIVDRIYNYVMNKKDWKIGADKIEY